MPTVERPINRPDIAQLAVSEYNNILRATFAYFKHKRVKVKSDGRTGTVVGVDPRPIRGGADGNFLQIQVEKRGPLPGRAPWETVYAMPDDVEILGTGGDTTTTS